MLESTTDVARLIAVVDLLVDEGRRLDRATIAADAAEHAARLTRAGCAVVSLTGDNGSVRGSYPDGASTTQPVLEGRIETSSCVGTVRASDPVDGGFSRLDAWLVEVVARRVESQLATVELHEAELRARDVTRDADVAGELHRALISAEQRRTPVAAGAGRLLPARRVGGDLFDLIEVDGGLLAVLADVSGKGAPASLLTSALLSSVHHHAPSVGARPGTLLAAVGRSMATMLDRTGRIITLAIVGVDRSGEAIRVASAGHHPVLLATGGSPREVRPTALPLGVVPPGEDEVVADFPAGSSVLLASDGITDQRDPHGVPFGMSRLAAALAATAERRPEQVVGSVLSAVAAHGASTDQDDDQAIVVVTSSGGIA